MDWMWGVKQKRVHADSKGRYYVGSWRSEAGVGERGQARGMHLKVISIKVVVKATGPGSEWRQRRE